MKNCADDITEKATVNKPVLFGTFIYSKGILEEPAAMGKDNNTNSDKFVINSKFE